MRTIILKRAWRAFGSAHFVPQSRGPIVMAALLLAATNLFATANVSLLSGGPNPQLKIASAGYVNGDITTNAEYNTPCGIAADLSGNYLFVADGGGTNNAIRVLEFDINWTSTLLTLSTNGLTLITNLFNHPVGVAIDSSYNLFVLNRGNGSNGNVLQFTIDEDLFATLVATNAVNLTNAAGLAVDFYDNIYVTINSNKVLKITSPGVSNVIATVTNAGANLQGLVVKYNGMLAVCDSGRNGIYLINPTNGVVSTNAGFNGVGDFYNTLNRDPLSIARFSQPSGVAEMGDGNLIVTDYGNHRVKVVTSSSVTNLYGVRSNYWYGPYPGLTEGNGTVTVPDNNYNDVQSRQPFGLVIAPNGSVYVTEKYWSVIRKVTDNIKPPLFPPLAPKNLIATADYGQVFLTWTASASPNVTNYIIKRSTVSGGSGGAYTNDVHDSTTGTSYTDTISISDGTPYYYVVSAVSSTVGEGPNSAEVSATPMFSPIPVNLTVTNNNFGPNKLSWSSSAGATSYNVRRSTSTHAETTIIASPTSANYNDSSNILCGSTYFYVVSAVNNGGESSNSVEASFTPPCPPPPAPRIGWFDYEPDPLYPIYLITVLHPFSTYVANNDLNLAIDPTTNGVGTFYITTSGPPQPVSAAFIAANGSTPQVTYQDGVMKYIPPLTVTTEPDLVIQAVNVNSDGTGSDVVTAEILYQVGVPSIIGNNAAQFQVNDVTTNVTLWYTIDGSIPFDGVSVATNIIFISTNGSSPTTNYFYAATTSPVLETNYVFISTNGSSPTTNYFPVATTSWSTVLITNGVSVTTNFMFISTNGSSITTNYYPYATTSSPVLGTNYLFISANGSSTTTNYYPFATTSWSATEITNGLTSLGGFMITNGLPYTLSIPMNTGSNVLFQARAFKPGYSPSGIASQIFSPANYVPNTISFGFEYGVASSDFVASPGQTFYAPVTLLPLSGALMYSLQFYLTVTNISPNPTAPILPDTYYFQSMLVKPIPEAPGYYDTIPPYMFITNAVNPPPTNQIVPYYNGQTNMFISLVTINTNINLTTVGWVEEYHHTNLYNTLSQDLIQYSIAHNILFLQSGGKVILGGYNFQVPVAASNGQTYQIQIGRPSTTSDGIGAPGSSVFINAPTNGSLGGGAVNAIKYVTMGQRKYIVGNVYPFRWFNAGDFGNTNLQNADVEQVFEYGLYGVSTLRTEAPGSDFIDAMDSCGNLGTLDGQTGYYTNNNPFLYTTDLSIPQKNALFDGNDTTINQIAFGDQVLDVCDVYVTYRRSLDPTLTWFRRFWTNGVRVAETTPNVFNPSMVSKASSVVSKTAKPALSSASSTSLTNQPRVNFASTDLVATAGQVLQIPITAQIFGNYPLRVLMLNLTVVPLDGSPALTTPVSFSYNPALGKPWTTDQHGNGNNSAVWLDSTITGLAGNASLGTLTVTIPTNATSSSAYAVHFDHASASPNGIASFPKQTLTGLITLSSRTNSYYNDGIPDSWRLRYFGTIYNYLSVSNADADGDGMNNWQEYVAGTDPNDPKSCLRLTPAQSQTRSINWPSVTGKTYVIQRSTLLFPPHWTSVSTNAGTGTTMEFDDATGGNVFVYRVQVQ